MDILEKLYELQDVEYAKFQAKLTPVQSPEQFIGVRTPALRKLAKEIAKDPNRDVFLANLPHTFFDENQLHAFIISQEKDFEKCIEQVDRFLPYINNWATCDQLSPKVFRKHLDKLEKKIDSWISSDHTYTVRFGIGMLMRYYLDEHFELKYPKSVAKIRSEEYYIKMMVAWYFATALAKQYEQIIPFLKNQKLDVWTHNKTIQKARESYRITAEQKDYLKTLKR